MKKTLSCLVVIVVVLMTTITAFGQTENYKKGLKAIKENRYHEAMVCFTKVVSDEKFEISGKDLSLAYAHLARIRTAYLEKALADSSFQGINKHQGQIYQTVAEMVRAVRFQTKSSETLIRDSRIKLEELSVNALIIIGDSLLSYDADKPNDVSSYLANFAIKQFGELSQLVTDRWQLHDVLGLSYYHLGDKENAMLEFVKAREQFAQLEETPNSHLHLRNYVLSGTYFFKEKKNNEEAYKISNEGSAYTASLIENLGDDEVKDILRLNKIENRFRQYMDQIKAGAN